MNPSQPNHITDDATLAKLFGVYTPDLLAKRCDELGTAVHLVEGLIPYQSLSLFVGDSGLGKSPLLYQLAICVAAGIDFLGHNVKQGPVLYMDYENSQENVRQTIDNVRIALGLSTLPRNLLLWNVNDAPPSKLEDLVNQFKPALFIVDPVTALYPNAEEQNAQATKALQQIRAIMKNHLCSVILLHHIKKPGEEGGASLEIVGAKSWLKQARGASTLVNGVDVRIALDYPNTCGTFSDPLEEIAIVFEGYGRIRGAIPRTYLARIFDEDGQAIGYREAELVISVDNPEQQKAFAALPTSFRHKEAKMKYGRGAQATTDFLDKFIKAGLLEKKGTLYVKTAKGKSSGQVPSNENTQSPIHTGRPFQPAA